MKAISSALGSFFLASLIVASTAFFLYLNDQSFKALSLYLESIRASEKVNNEQKLLYSASLDKYYPYNVKPLDYSCLYGNLPDLILRKIYIIVCSDKGKIALLFSFKNVSYHDTEYKLEIEYRLLSHEEFNITMDIAAIIKESQINLAKLKLNSSNFSSFSSLSILLVGIGGYLRGTDNVDLLLTISSNKTSFIEFDIANFYIRVLSKSPHFLILYLYNLSSSYTSLNYVIVFNSTDLEIFDSKTVLPPLTLVILKIRSSISNPLIKIITEEGSHLISLSD